MNLVSWGFLGVFVLSFKGTSLAPVQRRARGWCPEIAGIYYFFKYEEVWANIINFPRLNSSGLCMGMNPCRTWSQERSYFSCLQSSRNLYIPIQHTAEAKKSSTNRPTATKSCQKHQPPKPGRKHWGMRSGQTCSTWHQGTRSSEFLGPDTISIKPESQQFHLDSLLLWRMYLNKCFSLVTQSVYLPAQCIYWVLRNSIREK